MKQTGLLLILTALFLDQQACRSRQQTEGQTPDSTAVATETALAATGQATITERLADLGLTTDSDWRGINLGDDFARVKVAEKGEPFERDAKHVGYTIEFKNLETADMLYYQTGGKVSAIDVDLFLNNRQSVTDYQQQLEPYFTARYGASKLNSGGTIWTGSTGKTVALQDVSKGKDFGLKIRIAPTAGTATASTK